MTFHDTYRRQAALLVRTLPVVATENCFALKGGTAINLFVRDLPRLSVDIDLAYVPIAPRAQSLEHISDALERIASRLETARHAAQVTRHSPARRATSITRLTTRADGAQVKIEITPVLRGSVYEPELMTVAPTVEDEFGYAQTNVLSFADLYAGKIVAALDRQHPRDLFDVHDLLANEGVNDQVRRALVVYLISHNRPLHELLDPISKDITHEYERGFLGMTRSPIALDDLIQTRQELIAEVQGRMPTEHRDFLISFEQGRPDFDLLGINHADRLPAVLWKQQNLNKLDASKRARLVSSLEKVLDQQHPGVG